MKKTILLLLGLVFILTGCTKTNDTSLLFKKDYEALNGKTNKNGIKYRTVNISEDNPYIIVEASDIVKKIENKETFYVYFGDDLCPWCRSVIEKSIEVANINKIDKIYYVAIWDDDGNEILRDKFTLENGKPVKTIEGTDTYSKLLTYFHDVLSNYNLKDSEGNPITTGEKRIFAPNFIYVEKGKPIKMIDGISDKQKDSREKLTSEILEDEENQFNKFFKN